MTLEKHTDFTLLSLKESVIFFLFIPLVVTDINQRAGQSNIIQWLLLIIKTISTAKFKYFLDESIDRKIILLNYFPFVHTIPSEWSDFI